MVSMTKTIIGILFVAACGDGDGSSEVSACDSSWNAPGRQCEPACVVPPSTESMACMARPAGESVFTLCDQTFVFEGRRGCCIPLGAEPDTVLRFAVCQ